MLITTKKLIKKIISILDDTFDWLIIFNVNKEQINFNKSIFDR